MVTTSIMWGDGTSDKITITYSGGVGSSDMSVSSDPNRSLDARHKTIALKINGATMGTLSVSQDARSRAYSVSYGSAYE